MNLVKLTFIAALALLFVVSSIMTILSSSNFLGSVFRTYVLKYETCEYRPLPVMEMTEERMAVKPAAQSEKNCYVDYNQAKWNIAEGLAMLIISFPVAFLTYRQLRREMREAGNELGG